MKFTFPSSPTLFSVLALALLFTLPTNAWSETGEVALAKGGKALVPITISPTSSDELKATAAQFAGILGRITDAEFAIEESAEPRGITLGTLSQFPDPSMAEDLQIREGYDGVEAFVIRTDAGGIRLIGATDRGASHAAYRFLEHVGYRYFFMGSNWEITPSIGELSVSLNESSRPAIWSRKLGFTRMRIPSEEGDPNREEIFERWQAANLLGQSLETATNHVWHAIPNAFRADGHPFKAAFEAHPEYFALVNGKRTPPQFCVTNEGLQQIIIDYTRRFFANNPDADMVSLDPADQSGWCECDDCSKFTLHGDQAFYLANIAAKSLQESHPGKYVGILAYSWHSEPPDFPLAPNLFVQLTAGMNSSTRSFDDLLAAWSERSDKMGIYEYFTYWEMDKGMPPGKGPQNRIDDLPACLQDYVDKNVINITAEAGNSWGAHGLGYYVVSRLMWDPHADLDGIKRDFFEHAFGPAAPAMERYFERMNLSNVPFQGRILLRQSLEDLDEATRQAASRPDVLSRIDDLKTLLIYTDLGQRVDAVDDAVEKKELALEWFRWAHRIRNNYMIDWVTFRAALGNHEYSRTLAAEFNEPSWNYRHTKDNPWRDDRAVTTVEIESRLDKLRSEWGPLPDVAPQSFDGEWMLVRTGSEGKRQPTQSFTAIATYLMASREGEPLRFTLTSHPSPQIERQPARFRLTSQTGEVIKEGTFPEGENAVELEVPGPGEYRFSCRRGGRGWAIELPDELPAALLPSRDDDFRPNHFTAYFYVPKGTREVVFYAESGNASIRDPDGNEAFQGRVTGDFVIVPVPAEADGKVWTYAGKVRNPWFVNIPTLLSVDPSLVFVPRDLAEADGLELVIPRS